MDSAATQVARELLNRHKGISGRTTFRLLGREWDLLPGVYAPQLTRSAALYAEWIPYPAGGSLCEIGSGTGYLAVTAALHDCRLVHATDITPAAAENIALNARRHGVADRVSVHQGDLFAALPADERYDVIFWNSNFVETPADAPDDEPGEEAGGLRLAFYDADYRAHRAYLRDGATRLAPGGRLLLGFTSLGNTARLAGLAREYGLRPRVLRAVGYDSPYGERIRYQLLEFLPLTAQGR
ncbi:methyltransferase domain-containing protein [Streptomyces sp. NPDC020883]|uniref:methyltransferase domain-containing protein n=1 Tax=Streptomyces sp. NPDC020883 TaxID=3365099 RepID=UPI003797C825